MTRHDHERAPAPDSGALSVKVLTVSDGVVHGSREDRSGAALVSLCGERGWQVVDTTVTSDGTDEVAATLRRLADGFHGLIVTTGGTGFGPRDQTPEGTLSVLDRQAPGLAEAMRLVNPLGRLSRGVAGTLGTSLIINTPGGGGFGPAPERDRQRVRQDLANGIISHRAAVGDYALTDG